MTNAPFTLNTNEVMQIIQIVYTYNLAKFDIGEYDKHSAEYACAELLIKELYMGDLSEDRNSMLIKLNPLTYICLVDILATFEKFCKDTDFPEGLHDINVIFKKIGCE